jgi:alpha-amylase/alpha-mannosidase (GH57 family)
MDRIYLSFLWHMHQPYYKNLWTGEYLLPWVLLHGTKDYFDMAYMLKEFEGIKQNFNVVPSLLRQLYDYEKPGVNDTYLNVFRKPPETLSETEKSFLLMNFFSANWENMIKPFPRYYDLLKKRGFYYPREVVKEITEYFSEAELRDIQVLFFLVWIDPIFFNIYSGLRDLKAKGRGFTEEDKIVLEDIQREILKGIVPLYSELASAGVIEISTSPFYHPIIPLLIDNRIAREAMPDGDLPERAFSKPVDATRQIQRAIELFRQVFGSVPAGMWPPEGSVSDDALQLYMEEGVRWVSTDEEILFQSLKIDLKRDGGLLANPEFLYKPYRFERKDKAISIVFRDKQLSDLISFHYSKSDAKDAANDFIGRLKRIGESVQGRVKQPLITIAMDGENAWENYKNDGRDFLRYLYEGILREENIVPTTVSEYLQEADGFGNLYHCFAGSWIAHNFSIWIGHVEDNTGWTLLTEARDFLEAEDPDQTNEEAWESVYIAEGSDWFWWYGDEHVSENDDIFDFLFRESLSNVYRFLKKEPPEALSIPIMLEDREVKPTRRPVNFIEPVLDGRMTNYFEWMGAGFIEGRGHGVAMHESASMIKGCHYGFNERSLFLKVDIDRTFVQNPEDVSFDVNAVGKTSLRMTYNVAGNALEVYAKESGGPYRQADLPVEGTYEESLEVAIPFDLLGVQRKEKVGVWVSLKLKGLEVDRIPKRGYLTVEMPAETFEMEMWYV